MSIIFTVDSGNQLTRMARTDYESEELLQRLLADHPAVLGIAGNGDDLLLVRREAGIPDESGGSDRWSLDHLFLDREGVPVLVEVKRASDTRARREVVAQMLDYAAHITAHWEPGRIVDEFAANCAASTVDPDAQLREFLPDSIEPEDWWRRVEANLRSGRIRLVFVADRISKELRRIVEFLNEQMRPAEVLAIEVEQFVSDAGVRTLVPRLLGDTERAKAIKSVRGEKPLVTEREWWSAFEERHGVGARRAAEKLLAWFENRGCAVELTESQDSICVSVQTADGRTTWPFLLRRTGNLELSLQNLRHRPHFAGEEAREGLVNRLRQLPGLTISWTGKLNGWPNFPVEQLSRAAAWEPFTAFGDEVLQAAKIA